MHHGDTLKQILQERELPIQILEEVFDFSRQGVYNLLRKETFKKTELVTACVLLGIEPSKFGKSEGFMTVESSNVQLGNQTQFLDFQSFIKGSKKPFEEVQRQFLKIYMKSLGDFLLSAQHSIQITSYLAYKQSRSGRPIHSKAYAKERNTFFRKVESHLAAQIRNGEFLYIRVIQLPLGMADPARMDRNVDLLIDILYVETFRHLWHCLTKFEKHFRLYLAPFPLRLFTWMMVDNRTVLTEYDRYLKDGTAYPDMRFINLKQSFRPDGPVHKLIDTHLADTQKISKDNKYWWGNSNGLTKYQVEERFFALKSDRLQSIAKLKTEIQQAEWKKDQMLREHPEAIKGAEQFSKINTHNNRLKSLRKQLQEQEESLKGLNKKERIVLGR